MNLGVIYESGTVSLAVPHAVIFGGGGGCSTSGTESVSESLECLIKSMEASSISEDWHLSSQCCSKWT